MNSRKGLVKLLILAILSVIVIYISIGIRIFYYGNYDKKHDNLWTEGETEYDRARKALDIYSVISTNENGDVTVYYQKANMIEMNARIAFEKQRVEGEYEFDFDSFVSGFSELIWNRASARESYMKYYKEHPEEVKSLEELFPDDLEKLEPYLASQD